MDILVEAVGDYIYIFKTLSLDHFIRKNLKLYKLVSYNFTATIIRNYKFYNIGFGHMKYFAKPK